ncbi:hypothetical protein SAMN06269117_1037 [Balnearium lithotrophicum]|uniref:Uncharacterized protein n=1 Tax=Balnearium lithotrophicum TaxID=223788 RepID=A0A521AXA4_9BACT|nr:hypothetical protein [Balnearium lithotrophicum]SMO39468.1 hypothetical protein SAMN06269117_1037 [Balnearium lithotrophicum]
MRTKLLIFLVLLIPGILHSQEVTVLTDSASVREVPFGKIEKTLDRGSERELGNVLQFWGKMEDGWINLDYCNYTLPLLKKTGEIQLEYSIISEPIKIDGINLNRGDVVYFSGKGVFFIFNNRIFPIGQFRFNINREVYSISVLNRNSILSDGEKSVKVKAGSVILKGDSGFIYKNHFYTQLIPVKPKDNIDKSQVLKEINKVIDVFNSAKLSSPLAERLGYYAKTLPIKSSDLEFFNSPNGLGVRVKIKYEFFTKDGSPILGRKTRLFLKKSNYEFWRHISESLFHSGVRSFVDLEIFRFDGKNSFEDSGFVVSSYHMYKYGYLKNWKSFLENSESNLSDDLWFFADEVYERLEND